MIVFNIAWKFHIWASMNKLVHAVSSHCDGYGIYLSCVGALIDTAGKINDIDAGWKATFDGSLSPLVKTPLNSVQHRIDVNFMSTACNGCHQCHEQIMGLKLKWAWIIPKTPKNHSWLHIVWKLHDCSNDFVSIVDLSTIKYDYHVKQMVLNDKCLHIYLVLLLKRRLPAIRCK